MVATNGAALWGALLTPRDNWAARSAQRTEALQLQSYLTAQKDQEVLQEQQANAEAEQFLATVKSLPFLGRDREKLAQHLKGEEKQLFERLKTGYGGNWREFWRVEGPSFMSGASTRLKQSPFYSQALQNLQNVTIGQESHAKGENLVGQVGPGGYRTGEQQLQDFLAGKSDTYVHNGSYKPEDDFKPVRDTYAPGHMPWERVAMGEDEKLNHLIDTYGGAMGTDKYLRQHKGTAVFYKTDPLTKKFEFQMDQGRYGMAVNADRRAATQLGLSINADRRAARNSNLQAELLGLKIQDKRNELNGTSNGVPFDYDLLSHPSEVVRLNHQPGSSKKLPYSGIDMSKINSLAGVPLFGDASKVLAQQMGLTRTKDGYTGGNMKEAYTDANGGHAIDLSKSRFDVVSFEPKVYYDPKNVTPNGLNRSGVQGFAKVTVKFADDDDADRAGLYNSRFRPGSLLESSTKAGTGVYDPQTKTATFFRPIGNIDGNLNKPFMKAVQKNIMGQKAANESANDAPYLDITF